MRLEPTPRAEQTLRVSMRLITASNILHLSSDELEQAVLQEQIDNPALDVSEQHICLFCGTPLRGTVCASCGTFAQEPQHTLNTKDADHPDETASTQGDGDAQGEYIAYDIRNDSNDSLVYSDEDDELDPLARISVDQSLTETLLQQMEALIAPEDVIIAEHLVGNLNERGYLEISTAEIAAYLQVSIERVESILSLLQTLEPPGIGARDARECLLIQLAIVGEQETPHPLAATLIDRHLDRLGKGQYHDIARELKVAEQEVREAARYIRASLYPFPAQTYQSNAAGAQGQQTIYARPDVIIRAGDDGFEVELIEEKRYGFHIGPGYGTQPLYLQDDPAFEEVQRYLRSQNDRARLFIDSVHRRWRTLKQVAELIVDYQREFLEKGVRSLRPFTRAEVAARLNLDEGTVSRAIANKYALLPSGRLMPLADFFDSSLGIKDIMREVIASEQPQHRLSDDELARRLSQRGIQVARRTVTKYREEMGIVSSRER